MSWYPIYNIFVKLKSLPGKELVKLVTWKKNSQPLLKDGIPSLVSAARQNRMALLKMLIKEGVSVDVQDQNGVTPLMTAAREGHLEIVTYLMGKGADVTLTNKFGYTALEWAVKWEQPEIIKYMWATPKNHFHNNYTVTSLIRIASQFSTLNNKNTLFDLPGLLEYLGDETEILGALAVYGVLQDNPELLSMALNKGLSPNHSLHLGIRMLMMAVVNNSHRTAALLLDCGADPDATDNYERTARSIAENMKERYMIELILNFPKNEERCS